MANPLFQAMGGNKMPGAMGNMQQMFQQFQQFKNSFKGNPRDTVMQMVNSGRISQEQLNMAQQMAKQFEGFLK